MTPTRWPQASYLAALALACSACQHPHAPQPSATAAKPPDDAVDPGEQRAITAGAHPIGAPEPAIALSTIDGGTIDLGTL